MKKSVIFIIAIFCTTLLFAQTDYNILKINPDLLKNANVVKRAEHVEIDLTKLDKVVTRTKVAYTILNSNADKYAYMSLSYDKLSSINSMSANLYDAMGVKIKSSKKSDIIDESNTGSANLADDDRLKWINFFHKTYPYTVEFEYETTSKYSMFIPGCYPVYGANMSAQKTRYKIITNSGYVLRHKTTNLSIKPTITDNKTATVYLWELPEINAFTGEEYMTPWKNILPSIKVAPSTFYLEGFQGNMSSWKDFGKFQQQLLTGKDILPEHLKQYVANVAASSKSQKETINTLFKYIQNNTRYISIQLGVGGWQPHDAQFVADKKFGDCKALTNFMGALLKEARIPSHYALIKAGRNLSDREFDEDFVSSQFNHVILCVPNNKDTIWLECTSNIIEPGYLGSFTQNRPALLITENGGVLVKTPAYDYSRNLKNRKVEALVLPNGGLDIGIVSTYKNLQQEPKLSLYKNYSENDLKDELTSSFQLSGYSIKSHNYSIPDSTIPEIIEKLDISTEKYCQISGKRIFLVSNIITKNNVAPKTDSTKKYDFFFGSGFIETDTINIKLPEGYKPESKLIDVNLKTEFGNYYYTQSFVNNTLTSIRKFEKFDKVYNVDLYNKAAEFYTKVYKTDRLKSVFVKEE